MGPEVTPELAAIGAAVTAIKVEPGTLLVVAAYLEPDQATMLNTELVRCAGHDQFVVMLIDPASGEQVTGFTLDHVLSRLGAEIPGATAPGA